HDNDDAGLRNIELTKTMHDPDLSDVRPPFAHLRADSAHFSHCHRDIGVIVQAHDGSAPGLVSDDAIEGNNSARAALQKAALEADLVDRFTGNLKDVLVNFPSGDRR